MLKTCNQWVKHVTNPLHVYCRLIDFGINADFSRKVGITYKDIFTGIL